MTAQVAADLRAAADVLERDGWVQGTFKTDDGCRCVAQAIAYAVDGADESDDGWDESSNLRFGSAIRTLHGFIHAPPTMWNDTPGRSAAEVIAALRAAADRAEAQR